MIALLVAPITAQPPEACRRRHAHRKAQASLPTQPGAEAQSNLNSQVLLLPRQSASEPAQHAFAVLASAVLASAEFASAKPSETTTHRHKPASPSLST